MICKRTFTKTCVAGTVSWNTDDYTGQIQHIIIKPATSTTTYNFTMTGDNNIPLYGENGLQGTFKDTTKNGLDGIYTCLIDNASKTDEVFTIEIIYWEIPSA